MLKIKNKKRFIGYSLLTVCGITLLGLVASNLNFSPSFLFARADKSSEYSLTLNSTNKVTSAGDHIQKTARGNDVTFTYANVASSTSGHVTLNTNGTVVNKDHIRSIEALTCTTSGSGTLKFRLSYGGDVWNDYVTVESGYKFELSSNPYYIEFKAFNSSVTINSLKIEYSCVDTISQHVHKEEVEGESYYQKVNSLSSVVGDYLIVYENSETEAYIFDGSLTTLDATANYITSTIDESGHIAATAAVDGAKFTFDSDGYVLSSSGYYIYSSSYKNQLQTTTTKGSATANAISVAGGVLTVTASDTTLKFNPTATTGDRFRYYKSGQNDICLYEKVVTQGGTVTNYDTPETQSFENGFNATDSNANSYKTSDSYDLANGLTVYATNTNGSHIPLSKGNGGYSYVVKNSLNETIDSSKPFGGEDNGTYTVVVSYKNYIPVEIQISVEYVVALTGIEVNSSTLTFNTSQKLSDYTSGITADLSYNKSSENKQGVAYAAFASNGVALTLIDPSGSDHALTEVFGTAGTNEHPWRIKVTSTSNPSVYGELVITVNAIPVTNITVSGSSTSIEVGDQLQLTTNVAPNNATNQNLTWTSSSEGVATVSAAGLVTAISEGDTTIRATAQDGSNVYVEIAIHVSAKQAAADEGTYTLLNGSLTVGSYVLFSSTSSNGSAEIMGAQSGNIRPSVSGTITSGTITKDSNSTFHAFLVCEGSTNGTYAFYDTTEEVYLAATSSGSNYIGTESTVSSNSSWTVSGSATATITAQGSNSRKVLKYNYNNGSTPRFTCYATTNTTQTLPAIFTKAGQTIYPESISVSGTQAIAVGEASQLTVGYQPSTTTYKEVTYSSSNTSVATVSATGLVTAVAAGSTTITVTGYNGTNNITTTIVITVSNVSVTGVTVSPTSASISVGATQQLTATVSPSNATNKNVTWSIPQADQAYATVTSNGLVTGVAAGTAHVTVTTVDGGYSAQATITVTASGGGGGSESFTISFENSRTSDSSSAVSTLSSLITSGSEYVSSSSASRVYDGKGGIKFSSSSNDGSATITLTESYDIMSIVVNAAQYNTDASALTVNNSSKSISGTSYTNYTYEFDGTTTNTISLEATKRLYVASITIYCGSPDPVDPTSISISPSSYDVSPGSSKTLSVTYIPSNANQNKEITWSSNKSYVTVDQTGKVTVDNNATVGQSATITARLTNISSIYTAVTINIVESSVPEQTIMIYMCGSDLESGYDSDKKQYIEANGGFASANLAEILTCTGQTDDVNIIVETGGSHYWYNSYGMNASKLERWHVSNKSLVKDASITRTNMAASSTFQSFLEWGLSNYPAERTGVIMWDHGNGMQGCCSDEYNSGWDMLTTNEMKLAFNNAFSNQGISGQKLEWIGYDCCLMAMQDIASINADYFNYMISSQESEPGGGWDYDGFVQPLFNNPSITTYNLLKNVCDSYYTKVTATYAQYYSEGYSFYKNFNDTTLAIFDLSYMSAYVSAWEAMTTNLNINSKSAFTTLAEYAQQCYAFANTNDDGYGTGTSGVDAYDAYTFLNLVKQNYPSAGAASVQTAFNNVVIYKVIGKTYTSHAYGMSVFVATYGYTTAADEYTTNDTKFTNWRSINISYGKWYS